MTQLASKYNSPIWDVDDFSSWFRDYILQILVPLLLLLVSSIFLLKEFRPSWNFRLQTRKSSSYNGRSLNYGGLPRSSEERFHEEGLMSIAEVDADDLNGMDDAYQIYRVNNRSPRDISHPEDDVEMAAELSQNSIKKQQRRMASGKLQSSRKDTEIVLLKDKFARGRIAFEKICLLILCGFHIGILVFAQLTDIVTAAYNGWVSAFIVIYWTYCFVLASVRSLTLYMPKQNSLFFHSASLYIYQWFLSMITVRSILISASSRTAVGTVFINLALITALVLTALSSPTRPLPSYIEVQKSLEPCWEPFSSLFSILTFSFVDRIVWKGFQKHLTLSDVWDLDQNLKSSEILGSFRKTSENVSFLRGLLKFVYKEVIFSCLCTVIYALLTLAPTVILQQILRYIERPESLSHQMAWTYVFLMFISTLLSSLFVARSHWGFRIICMKTRNILISEIYTKALKRKIVSPSIDGSSVGIYPEKNGSKVSVELVASSPASSSSTVSLTSVPAAPLFERPSTTDIFNTSPITSGSIINLISVDAMSISETIANAHQLINGIILIIVSLALLYRNLGYSALAGVLTMSAVVPISYCFQKLFARIQADLLAISDKRIHKTNEIMQNMKIIKFFAWEPMFNRDLLKLRYAELSKIRLRFIIWSFTCIIWFGFPSFITFVTFAFYTLVAKQQLTASVAFSSLALFNLMRTPMDRLGDLVQEWISAGVSLNRIHKFISEQSTEKYEQLSAGAEHFELHGGPYIGIVDATLTWSNRNDATTFQLKDINTEFEVGKLTVIAGPTGSGKSSLLMALLGEMTLIKGHIRLPGPRQDEEPLIDYSSGFSDSVAYCSQQAWLLNDTIRNNILFGSYFDRRRYRACIEACALTRDFEILDNGDLTEVGEKGITLSGGQKQRISLARAVYSRASHLLLDDCLSAVDSHSALWIYERCILGPLMQGRTCILVTHNTSLTVPNAHHVIIMNNGRIQMQGTPYEVYSTGALGKSDVLESSIAVNDSSDSIEAQTTISQSNDTGEIQITNDDRPSEDGIGRRMAVTAAPVVNTEFQEVGHVKMKVYGSYFKSMGSYGFWILVILLILGQQGGLLGQSWWIREWANNSQDPTKSSRLRRAADMMEEKINLFIATTGSLHEHIMRRDIDSSDGHSVSYYLMFYCVIAAVYIVLSFFREFTVFFGSVRASKILFERLLKSVMKATPRYFDVTPVGRIMNRFSKDIECIDQIVAPDLLSIAHSILAILIILFLISAIVPTFIFAAIGIALVFCIVNIFYVRSSRELKRIQSVTLSPIYQHFGETLAGVTTIRAYGYESRFIDENLARIDTNSRPYWALWACSRWMSLRVEITGGIVATFAGAFVVSSVGGIDSGLAGLCLTYAISFSENMLWLILLYAVNEMNMNSVERIGEYLELEQEAPDIIPASRPPEDWPTQGAIEIDHLCLRYSPNLPRVIDDFSIKIKPHWKVGVVGRTGAGKSTIASAFFRFLEPESGRIIIDGIDISQIGLRDLRQSLAIIPQDPTLFTGTIRSNLDPFEKYNDLEIYRTLRRVHLISTDEFENLQAIYLTGERVGYIGDSDEELSENENKNIFLDLRTKITEGGSNLSQGQRQLMCLARSLLKTPRVIILDEATASIDYETDAKIQNTIREEFWNATILTVAHRLRSIADYDMILVLEAGTVKEYDQPHVLLQNPSSDFRHMCESSGELEALMEIAEAAYKRTNGLSTSI
ncbi:hypothetical protein V1511DRAFT_208660 [Dipodascopsis uninucleata]